MGRRAVLAEPVESYPERKRRIEEEALPANLGALLDEAARDAAETIAWNFFESGETITYGALRHQVDRLANGLRAAGLRKGSHVGVMLPNIGAMPTTWLALARLGAIMIPINPAYSGRELAYVLDDGAAEWLVIHESSLERLTDLPRRPPAFDDSRVIVVGETAGNYRSWESVSAGQGREFVPDEPVREDDLLNIQYTSGTTGFPKGVMQSHAYWLICGKQNAFRDGRDYKRILAATPFFYMDPQWLLVMSLYQRATLFVAHRQSASRFMGWIRDHRIQFALMPEIVIKQPHSPLDRFNEVIRVNVYGLSKGLHAALEERFDLVAREAYGMTEIGTGLFMPIEQVDMIGSGACGLPAPFREVRIANPAGGDVPPGEAGELLVRGRGITRGYYDNPEATEAAFHGDWFRTGDVFRRDARGFYEIVGRLKDMIRRAGENIAAREVESVILALPSIAEVAVVPVKDEIRGEEIKACLVLDAAAEATDGTLAALIAHCVSNLAPFKVPRFYEFRDHLPKTASGKIAKSLLMSEPAAERPPCFDRVAAKWL